MLVQRSTSFYQRGTGLIEVLVAMLVLSIGFLGIAMLQTRALSSNNGSMTRVSAVISSYTILDAMRIDRANALSGAYDGTVNASSCPTSNSTLAQIVLIDWCAKLRDTFAATSTAPTGKIESVSGSTNTYQVTITYNEGGASQTVITSARL
jgi:type IV pilus assembly protein PilV